MVPRLAEADPDGVDLLRRMLTYCPDQRITARGAMRHPYFAAYQAEGRSAAQPGVAPPPIPASGASGGAPVVSPAAGGASVSEAAGGAAAGPVPQVGDKHPSAAGPVPQVGDKRPSASPSTASKPPLPPGRPASKRQCISQAPQPLPPALQPPPPVLQPPSVLQPLPPGLPSLPPMVFI